jgi:hypothetical protein
VILRRCKSIHHQQIALECLPCVDTAARTGQEGVISENQANKSRLAQQFNSIQCVSRQAEQRQWSKQNRCMTLGRIHFGGVSATLTHSHRGTHLEECFLLWPKKHVNIAWNYFWWHLKNRRILSNRDVEMPSLVYFSVSLQSERENYTRVV